MGITDLTLNGDTPLSIQIADVLAFVLGCATVCFCAIAASLRFATGRYFILDGLSFNACGLYLVHYDFVVWLQHALLGTALFAIIKAAIVFGGTLLLSWFVVFAVQHFPVIARLIDTAPRHVAAAH